MKATKAAVICTSAAVRNSINWLLFAGIWNLFSRKLSATRTFLYNSMGRAVTNTPSSLNRKCGHK